MKRIYTVYLLLLISYFGFSTQMAGASNVQKISKISVSENSEFTAIGNQNEILNKIVVHVEGSQPIPLKNITVLKKAATNLRDVKNLKVYSTSITDTLFHKTISSAELLGSASRSKNKTRIKISGSLQPGINYLWLTADISQKAKEGNVIGFIPAELKYSDNTASALAPSSPDTGGREVLLARKILFSAGDFGSKFYRIPAIITAADGTLVTATDKRKTAPWDLPLDIDLIIRRSTDLGKTWEQPQTIAEGEGYAKGFGDPALVKLHSGKLLVIYAGGHGLWRSNPDTLIRTYVSESLDNGKTWSKGTDITPQLFGPENSDPVRKNWRASFCASGYAIQSKSGRVMVVGAVREGSEYSLNNYLFYSDDEGKTWHVSNKAFDGGDEAKVVELADGSILMSIRNKHKGERIYTISKDNGVTWGKAGRWPELIEPACNGDIIRYTLQSDGSDKNRLLHSIPNDPKVRKNVSVFISYDEGKTWPKGRTICAGQSAYSTLTILPDGTIGAYIEEGNDNMNMVYLNFSLEWLTRGADKLPGK